MVDVVPMLHQRKKLMRWSGNTLNKKLYLYQRKATRLCLQNTKLGLWMDQGTGKTLVMLKVITSLWKNEKINNVIIFAPKTVLSVWEKEIKDSVLVPIKFTDDLLNPQSDSGCLTICLKNYEALRSFKKSKRFKSYDLAIF